MIAARPYSKCRCIVIYCLVRSRLRYSYAISELKKDVEAELLSYPDEVRESLRAATHFAVFVVHNKLKPKLVDLPTGTR